MKKTPNNCLPLTFLLLFVVQHCVSQVNIHFHLDNTDIETREKLTALTSTITSRNLELSKTNELLARTLAAHRGQLGKNYTRNSFDKGDGFFLTSSGTLAMGIASSLLAQYPNMPYMTKAKRDYLNSLAMEKAVLVALQQLDASRIKSGKRQEIYRLRSQLIREFSKQDREARKLLLFSAGAWMITDHLTYMAVKKQLDAVEIAL